MFLDTILTEMVMWSRRMCDLSYRTCQSRTLSMVTWRERARSPRWVVAGKSNLLWCHRMDIAHHSIYFRPLINFTFVHLSAKYSLIDCRTKLKSKISSTKSLARNAESTSRSSNASILKWPRRCSCQFSSSFRTLCPAQRTSTATRKTSRSTSQRRTTAMGMQTTPTGQLRAAK